MDNAGASALMNPLFSDAAARSRLAAMSDLLVDPVAGAVPKSDLSDLLGSWFVFKYQARTCPYISVSLKCIACVVLGVIVLAYSVKLDADTYDAVTDTSTVVNSAFTGGFLIAAASLWALFLVLWLVNCRTADRYTVTAAWVLFVLAME
jgi:hypothetical protein